MCVKVIFNYLFQEKLEMMKSDLDRAHRSPGYLNKILK